MLGSRYTRKRPGMSRNASAANSVIQILKDVQRYSRGYERLFQIWKPDEAKEKSKLQEVWDEITDGSNLIFCRWKRMSG